MSVLIPEGCLVGWLVFVVFFCFYVQFIFLSAEKPDTYMLSLEICKHRYQP